MRNIRAIKAKDVLAYTTMPRVLPRVKDLFSSGFGYVSFLMAHVFAVVHLLPEGHPYLMPFNAGRFGFRHVIAQAAKNLKFSVKNIDQIIVFFAVLAGIVILIVQVILILYATLVSPVLASAFFDTVAPQTDVAFNILHEVFGVPGIFCSLSDPGKCSDHEALVSTPAPFHTALYGLFEFYSSGLMLIAVLLFLYFLVVVIVETVTTGTPFGQRFQNFWVPVRLVVALGLLMPIDYGLNSGQYIVLYTAKYASGFATKGWHLFNSGVANHKIFMNNPISGGGVPLGERYSFLALPEAPDVTPLVEAMAIVHACAYAYHRLNGGTTSGHYNETLDNGTKYPPGNANYAEENAALGQYEVQAFLVKAGSSGMVSGKLGQSNIYGDPENRAYIADTGAIPYYSNSDVVDAIGFYYGSDIIIRFGEFRMRGGNKNNYVWGDEIGYVKPLCGDIRIPISDLTDVGGAQAGRGGADYMQRFYYQIVLELWFNADELRQVGRSLVEAAIEQNETQRDAFCKEKETTGISMGAVGTRPIGFVPEAKCTKQIPSSKWRSHGVSSMAEWIKEEMLQAWESYVTKGIYAVYDDKIKNRGWGGAGIWYNKIAEINGGWMDSVAKVPYIERYPLVMEQIKAFKQQHVANSDLGELFSPYVAAASENSPAKYVRVSGEADVVNQIGIPLYEVYKYWNPPNDSKDNDKLNQPSGENSFEHAVHILLGTTGLLNIRGANQHMHPMAQLVAIGKGLVNSAVINMTGATTGAFLGGLFGGVKKLKAFAGLSDAASSMFFSVAFLGLTAGFVLFYVLPFLPFMYFFFAVANWVKAIFEAMLGVPLWALAHMRIDGEGLPGDAAVNGYFLIFEIFLRPIMTVIALLSAIIIFATQVRVLNVIWDLVVDNAAGFTEIEDINGTAPHLSQDASGSKVVFFFRSKLDQFFFTLIYTIVCYMLGMASFKLIDKIPDNILRWAGANVSAYGDIDQDNVESLSRYAAVGGMTIGNQAAGAVMKLGGGLGRSLGGQLGAAMASPPKGGGG